MSVEVEGTWILDECWVCFEHGLAFCLCIAARSLLLLIVRPFLIKDWFLAYVDLDLYYEGSILES